MLARQDYKPLAKAFHWLTALLVLLTIPAALVMLSPGVERSLQDPLFVFHKNIGVVILVLLALRLAYRCANPPPPLPASVPIWQRHAASVTHWLLYVLLLAMALSGYVRVTAGGFPLEVFDPLGLPRPILQSESVANAAKTIHAALRYPLISLIAIHIGAALYHAVVKRDGVVERML